MNTKAHINIFKKANPSIPFNIIHHLNINHFDNNLENLYPLQTTERHMDFHFVAEHDYSLYEFIVLKRGLLKK